VDRRADEAQREGRKDAAQRLWKVVLEATAPWARDEDGPPEREVSAGARPPEHRKRSTRLRRTGKQGEGAQRPPIREPFSSKT
jgi:hypothetical protein